MEARRYCRVKIIEPVMMMDLHQFDPVSDPRWPEFLESHPCASVFHTPGWLEALRRTYGYEPIGYTSSAPGEKIRNGVVFCRIDSWLTGQRMVSLPFSDHCEPLVDSARNWNFLCRDCKQKVKSEECNYLEFARSMEVFNGGEKVPASGQPGVIAYTTLTCGLTWTKFTEALTRIPWCGGFVGRNVPDSLKSAGNPTIC